MHPKNEKENNFLRWNYLDKTIYQIHENSNLDIDWDLIVVYNNLKKETSLNTNTSIFIGGEPPSNSLYTKKFLKQFDKCYTSHVINYKNHINSYPFTLPLYGKNFNQRDNIFKIDNIYQTKKSKKISFILTDKKDLSLQKKRVELAKLLNKVFPGQIDFFGRGFKEINDKREGLDDYMFSICIENSSIHNYWTEKLSDPIIAGCVPIYFGAPNINDLFDGIIKIDIFNTKSSLTLIKHILNKSRSVYDKYSIYSLINRNKVLYEYNIFNLIYEHTKKVDLNNYNRIKFCPMKYNYIDLIRLKLKNKYGYF